MKKPGIVLFLALFVYAVPAPTSNPGVVFEVETKDHEHSPPRVGSMEIMVENRNLKMDIMPSDGSGGNGVMIFRGDRGEHGEMVVVDHDRKEYYVMNDASMKAMAGQVGAVMSAVDEALKNLPKEQREAIEKAQKQGAAGMGAGPMKPRTKPEVRKTGERGAKEGYPCVKYEVFQDGKKIRDIWTTDWGNIDGGDEAEEAFKALGAFFEAFWKAMPPMPGGEEPFGGQNPFDEMNFENGFPVVVTGFGEDGSVEDESRLKGTQRRKLDPAAFEPPSGYKRRSTGPN
ncbi:MAG: hypothetical protein IH820_03250 [Bacteroidetes bacterium]|nr:hypothetical protein [Bacteroidota bacterium]